jgi:TrmH family RNA methyltransferase
MLISSAGNPAVREFKKLGDSARHRRETGLFVIEGVRLCSDALKSGVKIERAFLTDEAALKFRILAQDLEQAAPTDRITGEAAQKLADTRSPQGVFVVANMLDKTSGPVKIKPDGLYAALEDIQDPGNLGTILRTAEALGFDAVLVSHGSADVYSPKVLRGAMGAIFRLPVHIVDDLTAEIKMMHENGIKTAAAVADRGAQSVLGAGLGKGSLIAIGNEGSGLTDGCAAACETRVTIPMPGRAESLNAGTASAILMWEMCRASLESGAKA